MLFRNRELHMKRNRRCASYWANLMKGAALSGVTLLLLSPGLALAHPHHLRHGCESSPENPSLILALIGGAGAVALPYARSRISDWKRRWTGAE